MVHAGPTLCPFRLATGRPCPTCGMTRSWSAATRLDVRESLAWHPLGIPTVVGAVIFATGFAPAGVDDSAARRWAFAAAAMWIAIFAVRLVRPPARLAGRGPDARAARTA
ncbi:MAG: DUF2752 domain-containing protein [Chloroflexota bacterium]